MKMALQYAYVRYRSQRWADMLSDGWTTHTVNKDTGIATMVREF